MKRFTLFVSVLILVVLALFAQRSSIVRSQAVQNGDPDIKAAEAQVQVMAASRDSYSKHRALNALSESTIDFTVATKRVNDTSAAVAFGIRTNDPKLTSNELEIEVTLQPILVTSTDSLQKIGAPSKGVFHIGKSNETTSEVPILRETTYVLSVPKEANSVGFDIHVVSQGRDYGLNFTKGISDSATAATADRSTSQCASPETTGLRRNAERSHASRANAQGNYCCRQNITITCGTCTKTASCGTCVHNPDVYCSCQTLPCSCGIFCDVPTC